MSDSQFSPDNPHPLSTRKTELVWEGKYDEYGNRREVDTARLAMPLQRIETVDEPRARTESQGGLFDAEKAHLDDFRNMLIWGDNKLVMASLLKQFRGKVDLVYIDPPFDVGADFSLSVGIGDHKERVLKDQSTLEMVAYRDTGAVAQTPTSTCSTSDSFCAANCYPRLAPSTCTSVPT